MTAAASVESVRHLVVRAPNWVGDVVMCTPALRAPSRFIARIRADCSSVVGSNTTSSVILSMFPSRQLLTETF